MALDIAILASGSGTNAQAMIDKAREGLLDVRIVSIICNRPGAKVLERAQAAGIPAVCIDHKQYADRESFDREVVAAIGPITLKTLEKHKLSCQVMPQEYTIPALVKAIQEHIASKRGK